MPAKNKKITPVKNKVRHLAAADATPVPAPKGKQKTETRIVFVEAGSSGLKEWSGFVTEAYNAQLFWPTVQPLYSKIRRSMPEVVMIRQAFTSWARNIRPIVELPDKPTDDDKKYQDFIESDFENMDGGFTAFIDTMVNHVPFFGWGWWEAVPGIRDPRWRPPGDDDWRSELDDGMIGMRRLAWRDTATFAGWDMNDNKRVKGLRQLDYPNKEVILPLDRSLHLTFGDPNNPEGASPLEAVWRLERLRYGYEVVMGIGAEHAAGHVLVKRVDEGTLTDSDKAMIEEAAKNLLSGQEGNFAYTPAGLDLAVIDVPFAAGATILDIVKHYSILALSVYTMQWIALNTMTNTGAQASQVDSTDMGVFTFNSMMDGFAAQYDRQIGRRLFDWNRYHFPGVTRRPKIKFSHIDKAIALAELGSFLGAIDGVIPLTLDDYKAFRKRSGFLPENVDMDKELKAMQEARAMDQGGNNQPGNNQDNNQQPQTNNAQKKKPAVNQLSTFGDSDDDLDLEELGGAGSGFYGHKGRDAENLRGGSVPKDSGDGKITISVSKVHPTGRSVVSKLKNGVKTTSEDAGITGHGFRYMGEAEFKKFADGKLKYGGVAENEHDKGVMFANAPGDFFYAGGSKKIYLIEVNKQGVGSGLDAPKGSVGLSNVVGAWVYNPDSGFLENLIVNDNAELGGVGSGYDAGHRGRPGLRGGSPPRGSGVNVAIQRAIARTFSHAQGAGGITIKADKSGYEPKDGYVVATSAKWGYIIEDARHKSDAELRAEIRAYKVRHAGLLSRKENYLGLWLNKDDGNLYLDVSEVVDDLETAKTLGASRDQKAIWDIRNKVEIPTGGSGNKGDSG